MKDAFQDGIPLDYNGEMLRLNDEINKASDELAMKVAQIDGDIITARNNPEIRNAWNRLCRLHMKAMVSCTYDPIHQESIAKLCEELSRPRACVKLLQLSEEQTCCARFMKGAV